MAVFSASTKLVKMIPTTRIGQNVIAGNGWNWYKAHIHSMNKTKWSPPFWSDFASAENKFNQKSTIEGEIQVNLICFAIYIYSQTYHKGHIYIANHVYKGQLDRFLWVTFIYSFDCIYIFWILFSSCAKVNLKKVSLELGGKSPLIIFSDCDMDKAVRMVGTNYF